MLKKIRDHPTHTALAIGMVAIGLFLIINDNYFIWPPHYSDWLNNDMDGFLFVIDGLGIGGWVLWETQSAVVNRLLLTARMSMVRTKIVRFCRMRMVVT